MSRTRKGVLERLIVKILDMRSEHRWDFCPVGVGSPASLNGSVGNMRADFGSATEEAAYWRSRFEQVSKESQLTKEEFAGLATNAI